MFHLVAPVRTDVSEEINAYIIRVKRIDELRKAFADSCHHDHRGAKFIRNVGSYKSHTA
jgi:hypothetical protein